MIPSNSIPFSAARAVPALNSSLYSINAKFLGAKRTSLNYGSITQGQGNDWTGIWAFLLWFVCSSPDRTKCGWEDCWSKLIGEYFVELSGNILFSFYLVLSFLRSMDELLLEFLLEIVFRPLSDMESSIKFGNDVRFFFSKVHFLIHGQLTIVLP